MFIKYLRELSLTKPLPIQKPIVFDELFYNFNSKKYIKLLNNCSAEVLDKEARKKALQLFHLAANKVPAYKKFLVKNKINEKLIKTHEDFKKIPPINKKNYLRKYNFDDFFWYGNSKSATMLSVSSGSTGAPFFWPRSCYLEYETAILHEIFMNEFFKIKKENTLVVIAYSMGAYVAGTFTLNSMRNLALKGYNLLPISPGIDIREVIISIKKMLPKFSQVIIAGYPPFIKDIVDEINNKKISFHGKKIGFIFGAENFSEEWREHILRSVGINSEAKIISSSINTYGSADAAILGHETPLTIELRRKINKKHACERFFGTSILPTLVQYNPLMKFFEEEKNNLYFTCEAGFPLVRYDIKDTGKIFNFKEFKDKNILISKKSKHWENLPILALFGRKTNTVTLYGLNIYPENIKIALELSELKNLVSGKFRLSTQYDKLQRQFLQIEIEAHNKKIPSFEQKKMIGKKIVSFLIKFNLEYSKLYSKIGDKALPKIIFFPRGKFLQERSKHRWVNKP